VGRGTGVDAAGLARTRDAIVRAFAAAGARVGLDADPLDTLARFGGFEIAMMAGAMLGAAAMRQVVVVDGFIATAAAAAACRFAPALQDYCVFAHVSAEQPHRLWLQALGAQPLLDLGLRLGEGSGAILAVPLLHAATAILREMATFASAGVSGRSAAPST
jgi:nicotinate-nucleotide--dimethylbenzimidazole phosphoribosyltransferase